MTSVAGRHQRQHRQSRSIDCVRVVARRRVVRHCGTAGKQSGQERRDARVRCHRRRAREGFRRSAGMGRARSPGRGFRYVHSANEPLLIAGVGTYALEIFEDISDPDVILVPIGGGSGACGCCIAEPASEGRARHRRAGGRADAFTRSWRGPQRVSAERTGTFAEGLATRFSFDLTFGILNASSTNRHADRNRARGRRAAGAARDA